MNKEELKEKSLQLREEKLKQSRERLELRKEVWNKLKDTEINPPMQEIIKMLLK